MNKTKATILKDSIDKQEHTFNNLIEEKKQHLLTLEHSLNDILEDAKENLDKVGEIQKKELNEIISSLEERKKSIDF